MKYQIDAISVVEREKPVDVTFLKMILCKEIEKNITVFSILDTKIRILFGNHEFSITFHIKKLEIYC